jgi:hypothetical protein
MPQQPPPRHPRLQALAIPAPSCGGREGARRMPNEICCALLQVDVRFDTARDVKANINRIINIDALAAGTNKRRIIQ